MGSSAAPRDVRAVAHSEAEGWEGPGDTPVDVMAEEVDEQACWSPSNPF